MHTAVENTGCGDRRRIGRREHFLAVFELCRPVPNED
jgi:hypothetical protein